MYTESKKIVIENCVYMYTYTCSELLKMKNNTWNITECMP